MLQIFLLFLIYHQPLFFDNHNQLFSSKPSFSFCLNIVIASIFSFKSQDPLFVFQKFAQFPSKEDQLFPKQILVLFVGSPYTIKNKIFHIHIDILIRLILLSQIFPNMQIFNDQQLQPLIYQSNLSLGLQPTTQDIQINNQKSKKNYFIAFNFPLNGLTIRFVIHYHLSFESLNFNNQILMSCNGHQCPTSHSIILFHQVHFLLCTSLMGAWVFLFQLFYLQFIESFHLDQNSKALLNQVIQRDQVYFYQTKESQKSSFQHQGQGQFNEQDHKFDY